MIRLKYLKLNDALSIALITFSTLLYFILSYIPEGFKTIDLYFFEIRSFGFPDTAQLVYYVKMKALILTFALIWYFTCKQWWKSAILVIIAIELAKIVTALNSAEYSLDEIDYITSLPITLPIIIVLYLISYKLNAYNLSMDLHSKIDDEIDAMFYELNGFKNEEVIKFKKELSYVRKFKSRVNDEAYLKKLLAIRNDYYKL